MERFKNLNRVEFIITYDCTGGCKHCSEGNHPYTGVHIDAKTAKKAVCDLKEHFDIKTVMTFGGEPLMYTEPVYEIHRIAKELGIEKRQLITNGFFSKDLTVMKNVAEKLKEVGINDLLLSADAFHQETIPLDVVLTFAKCCLESEIPVRLNPAYLVSRDDKNEYNIKTKEIISHFTSLGIPEGDGNVVFPEGNAKIYLAEYFPEGREYINPYEENPFDIRSISIEPDGKLYDGNIYKDDVIEILKSIK